MEVLRRRLVPSGQTVLQQDDLEYLTIESLEDGNTISWKAQNSSITKTISVSTDNGTTWTNKSSTTSGVTLATLDTGDKLLIKGYYAYYSNTSYFNYFESTKEFNVKGNIMSLRYFDNFIGQTTLNYNCTFRGLFYNCTKLKNAEHLSLPATTLTQYCYQQMFYGCTGLTTAPTTLPATTLAIGCYSNLFQKCTSLTTAPALLATTLAQYCYSTMFRDCTSLTTAPELPATTLSDYCYQFMFNSCSGLTTAPELPATALSTGCYQYMFQNCTSLITAPDLPAITLTSSCYRNMFNGCTSLNYIKCIATNINASNCTNNWVNNVAASGTFTKAASMSRWKTGTSGIPSNWTVVNAS